MTTMTRVAPELRVHDLGKALEYYENKLGFEVVMRMPEGDYAIVERDDVALHLFQSEAGHPCSGSAHIFVTDLDTLFAELQTRQADITQEIVRQPWGNRDFRVGDSAGNLLKFTEPLNSLSP